MRIVRLLVLTCLVACSSSVEPGPHFRVAVPAASITATTQQQSGAPVLTFNLPIEITNLDRLPIVFHECAAIIDRRTDRGWTEVVAQSCPSSDLTDGIVSPNSSRRFDLPVVVELTAAVFTAWPLAGETGQYRVRVGVGTATPAGQLVGSSAQGAADPFILYRLN